MDNGEERPIAFASRSLTKSETNYAQLEKDRGSGNEKVPQISVWPFLHSRYRSSPVSHNSGTNKGPPTISSCENGSAALSFCRHTHMMSNIVQGVSIVMQMLCLACHANIQIAQKRKSSSSSFLLFLKYDRHQSSHQVRITELAQVLK